jgi:uncharacterized phage protein (TIGR02218 family)
MCGLNKANYASNVTAVSGSAKDVVKIANGYPSGYFTQGTMLCKSGANAGVTRYIKSFDGGNAIPAQPFQNAVSAGDTFTFWRGCAKTMVACQSYGNMANFRGFPFLPCKNVLL